MENCQMTESLSVKPVEFTYLLKKGFEENR